MYSRFNASAFTYAFQQLWRSIRLLLLFGRAYLFFGHMLSLSGARSSNEGNVHTNDATNHPFAPEASNKGKA
jgi:hypothetical protein